MTDKEKIRDEIERRKKLNVLSEGKFEEDVDILSFIDSTQEEPVSEDLDCLVISLEEAIGTSPHSRDTIKEYLLKAANWQREQFEKERLKHCDELSPEDAQTESVFVVQHLKDNSRTPTFIDAIKYGMKVQRELMINEAVVIETSMMEDDCDDLTPVIGDMRNKGFKFGDRVKLIIIKED